MPGASCTCEMARWNMIVRETEGHPVGSAGRPQTLLARCFAPLVRALLLLCIAPAGAASPYLTGVVEDGEAQTVEMPRLPGSWQRSVEWMAPEGSTVSVGDLIVRLDPGRLIALEEQAAIDLERRRYENERRQAELDLAIKDAETAVLVAESAGAPRADRCRSAADRDFPVDPFPRSIDPCHSRTGAGARTCRVRRQEIGECRRAGIDEVGDRESRVGVRRACAMPWSGRRCMRPRRAF